MLRRDTVCSRWADVGIYVRRGTMYNFSSDQLGEVGPTIIFNHEAKNLPCLVGVGDLQ
jgi:hypothetical protein